MKSFFKIFLLSIVFFLLPPVIVFAGDIGFVNDNIWVSKDHPVEGDSIEIYAVIVNSGDKDIQGTVVFSDEISGEQIGHQIPFTLGMGGTSQVVSSVWTAVAGDHQFKAKIVDAFELEIGGTPKPIAQDLLSQVTQVLFVDVDSDYDGVPDLIEEKQGTDPLNPDTNNDGLVDGQDPGPTTPDTDGDGDLDGTDPNPTDPSIFSPADFDNDGIPDGGDSDMDNDGLYNFQEEALGTDKKNFDTDGDGYNDKIDGYPLDPNRWDHKDTDDDGIPDSEDPDIDGDGLYNFEEEVLGTDPYLFDTDGDTFGDKEDLYPLDETRWEDEQDTDSGEVLGQKVTSAGLIHITNGGTNGLWGRFLSLSYPMKVAAIFGINLVFALLVVLIYHGMRSKKREKILVKNDK